MVGQATALARNEAIQPNAHPVVAQAQVSLGLDEEPGRCEACPVQALGLLAELQGGLVVLPAHGLPGSPHLALQLWAAHCLQLHPCVSITTQNTMEQAESCKYSWSLRDQSIYECNMMWLANMLPCCVRKVCAPQAIADGRTVRLRRDNLVDLQHLIQSMQGGQATGLQSYTAGMAIWQRQPKSAVHTSLPSCSGAAACAGVSSAFTTSPLYADGAS